MEQLEKFLAVFSPTRTDDLRPHLVDLIGRTMTFYRAWLMGEDDPFPGVWACRCTESGFREWVPEFDLKVI